MQLVVPAIRLTWDRDPRNGNAQQGDLRNCEPMKFTVSDLAAIVRSIRYFRSPELRTSHIRFLLPGGGNSPRTLGVNLDETSFAPVAECTAGLGAG